MRLRNGLLGWSGATWSNVDGITVVFNLGYPHIVGIQNRTLLMKPVFGFSGFGQAKTGEKPVFKTGLSKTVLTQKFDI